MSRIYHEFSVPTNQRNRHGGFRRLRLETLEPRACPAVMFDFVQSDAGGILHVIGDDDPNVIEIIQPREGVVEVTGDGEQRTFSNVDEIFVATLGGDDATTYSPMSKEIVVVGAKIHIDTGAGNDRIEIDGDNSDGSILLPRVKWEVAIDLGTGADELSVEAGDVDALDLDVRSADGGDRVAIGHTIGFRHEHTRPEAQIDMDLGGDGNLVDVRLENIEDVDLSIDSDSAPGEPLRGGTINVYWHVIHSSGPTSAPQDDGVVILYSSLPGGSASGISPTSLSFSAVAGDDSDSSASAALNLDPLDDTVSIRSWGVDNLDLDVNTGDGNDSVDMALEGASPNSMVGSHELHGTLVKVNSGAGDDRVAIGKGQQVSGRITGVAADPLEAVIDLGTGADELTARISNTNTVHWDVHSSDGFDSVDIRMERSFPGFAGGVSVAVGDVNLEGGNNLVNVDTDGYDHVDFDGSFAGGDNQVDIGLLLPAVQKPPTRASENSARVALDFGGSNNQGSVSNRGFGVWEVNLATPASSDAPTLQPTLLISKMRAIRDHVAPPAGSVTFIIDGNPQSTGSDVFNIEGSGFTDVDLNVDSGIGDDFIGWNVVNNGKSDSAINVNGSMVLGPGDDTVQATVLPSVTDLIIDPFGVAALDINAGDGNDNAVVQIGVNHVELELSTGDGDDRVTIEATAKNPGVYKTTDSGATWNVDLGGGNDHLDLLSHGFSRIDTTVNAGDGNDTIVSSASPTSPSASPKPVLLVIANQDYYLGPGNDLLTIKDSSYTTERIDVDAGDGDDTIVSNSSPKPGGAVAGVLYAAFHNHDLGPGNDRLVIEDSGYTRESIFVDAGDGDDEVRTRVTSVQVTFNTQVTFVMHLGAGDDKLAIESTGYRQVKLAINSGPEGDGVDSVTTRLQAPGSGSRKQSGRLTLDGGKDIFEYKAKGYRVQSSSQTSVSVEWVFVA